MSPGLTALELTALTLDASGARFANNCEAGGTDCAHAKLARIAIPESTRIKNTSALRASYDAPPPPRVAWNFP